MNDLTRLLELVNDDQERDRLADQHRDEMFKLNPGGFTVAPYVNSETLSDAFVDGYNLANTRAKVLGEIILKLIEQRDFWISKASSTSTGKDAFLEFNNNTINEMAALYLVEKK